MPNTAFLKARPTSSEGYGILPLLWTSDCLLCPCSPLAGQIVARYSECIIRARVGPKVATNIMRNKSKFRAGDNPFCLLRSEIHTDTYRYIQIHVYRFASLPGEGQMFWWPCFATPLFSFLHSMLLCPTCTTSCTLPSASAVSFEEAG